MSDLLQSTHPSGEVSVHLLDSSQFHPIKTWTFTDRERITIGRSPDQDVELSDPYVSRHHVELTYRAGLWRLISKGRHGVLVASRPVTEISVEEMVRFRLGSQGPTLRFNPEPERAEALSTAMIETLPTPEFHLDEQRIMAEVGEIATGDYFQELQERAKKMRRQRGAE